MPKMNGGVLAAKLKMIRPNIRVAFMSGYSSFPEGKWEMSFLMRPSPKTVLTNDLVGIVRAMAEISPDRRSQQSSPDRMKFGVP